jgi:hypothetical protein
MSFATRSIRACGSVDRRRSAVRRSRADSSTIRLLIGGQRSKAPDLSSDSRFPIMQAAGSQAANSRHAGRVDESGGARMFGDCLSQRDDGSPCRLGGPASRREPACRLLVAPKLARIVAIDVPKAAVVCALRAPNSPHVAGQYGMACHPQRGPCDAFADLIGEQAAELF